MDTVASILVLLILPQLVVTEVPTVSFRAVLEIVGDNSRIFTGESIRLRCSIPEDSRSDWEYLWFRGGERLRQTDGEFSLWNAKAQQSGKFSCQGVRDTVVGNIYTVKSPPVEINVDGGWAILQVSPRPAIIGDTLNMTCRVRGDPPANNVILYKDGVQVIQNGKKKHFYLTNLTLEDQGMYSCRASWDIRRRTHSVVSVGTYVQILEVLSEPVLEIIADDALKQLNKIKLLCHVDFNTRAPAPPPVHYYFYKDNNQLGTATDEGRSLVSRSPGLYSCKVKVPELGLLRWSEAKSFGKIAGPRIMAPPRPRYSQPLAPPVLLPGRPVAPAAQPTVAQLPTPVVTEESIQPSEHPPKPSQPVPTTLLTILQSANRTTAFLPPAAQPTTAHRSTPTPFFTQRTEESIQSSERPVQLFSHTTPDPASTTPEYLSGESDDTIESSGGEFEDTIESSGVPEISAESVTLK